MQGPAASLRVLLASLFSIGAITAVCYRLLPSSPTTAALLLLLAVLLTAASARRVVALIASLMATLCLDLFFLPPIGSITISDPQNWVALIVFCALSLLTAQVSIQLRVQRNELLEQQRESERLHDLSRSLLLSGGVEDMRRLIVNRSTQLFELTDFAVYEQAQQVIFRSGTERPYPENAMRLATEPVKVEMAGAQWQIEPVCLGNLPFGSMAFVRAAALPPATVRSWASTVALGLAQVQAQEATNQTVAIRRSEELKSVMIDALAHNLKTPLTAIEVAASMLAQSEPLTSEQTGDMINVIAQEAQGLRRLVDEAIHLARIDANRLKLELQSTSVRDLLRAAVQSLGDKVESQRFDILVGDDLPGLLVDGELMIQALKQLLDNALKYSPPRSIITVSADSSDGVVTIAVRDNGAGLTELEQSRVFDKFYRGRYDKSSVPGTGMGLAIAREITEAHGGSVGVRSYIGQGTEFFVSLKAEAPLVQQGQSG